MLSPLFTWRSAISDPSHDLPSTARHVALALSLHMNERGGSCFPAISTLAGETNLDDRTVQRAIRRLEADRWLVVAAKGGMKNGSRVANTYRAVFPDGILRQEDGEEVVDLTGRGRVRVGVAQRRPKTIAGVAEMHLRGGRAPGKVVIEGDKYKRPFVNATSEREPLNTLPPREERVDPEVVRAYFKELAQRGAAGGYS